MQNIEVQTAIAATVRRAPEEEERLLLETIAQLLSEVGDGRGQGHIHLDASLERDLGLGSLERVELVGRIESAFAVRLPEEAIAQADTPRRLLELARGKPAAGAGAGPGAGAGTGTGADGSVAQAGGSVKGVTAREVTKTKPAPVPEKAKTLVEVLEYRAVRDRDRVHIVLVREDGGEDPLTYGEMRREAGIVADHLRGLGLEPGSKVAIMLPTSRGYFATFLGAQLAGYVPVPLYPPFRLDRIAEYIEREARILESAEARALVTFDRAARVAALVKDRVPSVRHVVSVEAVMAAGAGASQAASAAARVGPDDVALIQYTSGSTGDPKGVVLTHANVLANIHASSLGCELSTEDVMVSWLPLYHDMGLIGGWLMNFRFGNPTVVLSPLTFLSRPETWLQAMQRHGGTISVAPNFAFELCTRRVKDEDLAKLDLSSMRSLLNGSEPIVPATLERFVERFAKAGFRRDAIFCSYGLAENMVGVSFPKVRTPPTVDVIERAAFEGEGRAVPAAAGASDVLRFVGCGYPLPTVEVRIADEAGSPVPERKQGRLLFRGPSAFQGYHKNPEATAKVKLADGWNDSGDLAYVAEGQIFICGRVKDLIIKGGKNYYPHEIEDAASGVTGIRTGCVAAFASRDEQAGTERIVVLAETKERDRTAREMLVQRIREAVVAAVGVPPDEVVLCGPGAVPKTSSGKIRRTEARRLWQTGELSKGHGSFAQQAAGLYLRSLPARAVGLAKTAAHTAYGAWAISTFMTCMGAATALGQVWPGGRPLRALSFANAFTSLGLTGLLPHVKGLEKIPKGAALLCPNHASYLDPYVLSAALDIDTRYVIKGECRDSKAFGPMLLRADHVLIERKAAEKSLDGIEEMLAHLRKGERVVIFPEGTFKREDGLLPFKLGAFRVACTAGVPVVPIALRGTRKAYRDGMWLPRRERIEVEVLDPILPTGTAMADWVRLRDRCADAIAAKIDEPRLLSVNVNVAGQPGAGPG